MNLMTYFFLNFFLYLFLWRYSPVYYNSNFQFHFFQTILLGIIIIGLSIGLSLVLRKILKHKITVNIEDLVTLASMGKKICPNCGTEFESIPKFCYKCIKSFGQFSHLISRFSPELSGKVTLFNIFKTDQDITNRSCNVVSDIKGNQDTKQHRKPV